MRRSDGGDVAVVELGRWSGSETSETLAPQCTDQATKAKRCFGYQKWYLRASSHLAGRTERPNPKLLSRGETKVH